MISNFALLLSQEGIKLAHRTPDGWSELGHVDLLDPELPAKIEALRQKGQALAVTDFTTKIVLPNDQIKYLTLPSVEDDQRESVIKDALERTTPYLIDELAYDWEEGEAGMNVAAVARDTLAEAEDFVVQFGFKPTSFVAAPDDAIFSVEPFFGTCAGAAEDQDLADSIEAEVDKVFLTQPQEAPMAEVVDDISFEADVETVPLDRLKDTQADDPIEDDTKPDVPEENTDPETPVAPEDSADPDTDSDTPDTPAKETGFAIPKLVAYRDDDESHLKFPSLGPAITTSILDGGKPRIKPAPRFSADDEDLSNLSVPSWVGKTKSDNSFSADEKIEPKSVGWLKSSARIEDPDSPKPPEWMTTGVSRTEPATPIPASQPKPDSKQPRYEDLESEAEKLEIFGARGAKDRTRAPSRLTWLVPLVIFLLILIGGAYLGARFFIASSSDDVAPVATNTRQPADGTPDLTGPAASESIAATAPQESTVLPADVSAEATEPTPSDTANPADTIAPLPTAQDTGTAAIDLPKVNATTEIATATPLPVTENPSLIDRPSAEQAPVATTTAPGSAPTQAVADTTPVAETTPVPAPDAPAQTIQESVAPADQILDLAPRAGSIAPNRPNVQDPLTLTADTVERATSLDETTPAPPAPVATAEPQPTQEADVHAAETAFEPEPATAPDAPAATLSTTGPQAITDWADLSPEARAARYAATGIWPIAPEAPEAPVSDSVGALYLTTVDPVVFATDAYALTPVADLLSDKALTTVPNPPAPGTRFDRDARGLVRADPDGALTPDGILVFAGIPPQIPPLAPRPDLAAQQAAQRAALAGKVPQLRPAVDAAEPVAEAVTQPTGNLPPLRPAEVAALAASPAVAINPLALDRSPLPRLRPKNMGEIVYNTERAVLAAQTTTAVAPSNQTVSQAATEEGALNLRGVTLIGIYGTPGDRRALVRLQSGQYKKIQVGDDINGGVVTAIDQDRVLYVYRGKTIVLRMPSP